MNERCSLCTTLCGAPLHDDDDVYNLNCCHPHCMAYVNSLTVQQTSNKSITIWWLVVEGGSKSTLCNHLVYHALYDHLW